MISDGRNHRMRLPHAAQSLKPPPCQFVARCWRITLRGFFPASALRVRSQHKTHRPCAACGRFLPHSGQSMIFGGRCFFAHDLHRPCAPCGRFLPHSGQSMIFGGSCLFAHDPHRPCAACGRFLPHSRQSMIRPCLAAHDPHRPCAACGRFLPHSRQSMILRTLPMLTRRRSAIPPASPRSPLPWAWRR